MPWYISLYCTNSPVLLQKKFCTPWTIDCFFFLFLKADKLGFFWQMRDKFIIFRKKLNSLTNFTAHHRKLIVSLHSWNVIRECKILSKRSSWGQHAISLTIERILKRTFVFNWVFQNYWLKPTKKISQNWSFCPRKCLGTKILANKFEVTWLILRNSKENSKTPFPRQKLLHVKLWKIICDYKLFFSFRSLLAGRKKGAILMHEGPNERKNSWAEDQTQI